ncbi:MAG: 4Fe-4S binding protein [Deltaproteobacteria bacterium]|nr:4Fe-4S binding protein [Deltaproteobacteria bacterium]
METFRYLPGTSTLVLDTAACVGCGECSLVCPHGVFLVTEGKAKIVDIDGCMECGACAVNCSVKAITVNPGVGCAAYVLKTWLKGKGIPTCGSAGCC